MDLNMKYKDLDKLVEKMAGELKAVSINAKGQLAQVECASTRYFQHQRGFRSRKTC